MAEFTAKLSGILGSLGGPVLVIIVLFLLGICFRAGIKNSLRGGIYAGIGLAGLFVVINSVTAVLTPAIQDFAKRFGTSLTITDVGWGVSGVAFAWPGLALTLILVLGVNALLVMLKITKTMWTDIWSIWHGQVVGGFIWAATGNVILGVVGATLFLIIGSFIADWTAKDYQEFNELPGISVPCTVSLLGLVAKPFNSLLEAIPVIKDINASPENIRKRIGIFGELGIMGTVIGIIIGILAGYGYAQVLNIGIQVGVLMVFLPKTVSVLCEGVIPIANAVNEFVQEKFEGREVFVGVDCAALLGHPSVMASAVLLYPLSVILGVFLPGNGLIPIASLAIIPYWCGAVAPQLKGNVFRIVLFTLIWMIPVFYLATYMAPIHTKAMADLGLSDPNMLNSSLDMGGDLLGTLITKIFTIFK